MSITLHNLRNIKPSTDYDFRVDRTSPVGNPFQLTHEGLRDEVCDQYDTYFDGMIRRDDPLFVAYLDCLLNAYRLHGRLRLFCWCTPSRCHGETVVKYISKILGIH